MVPPPAGAGSADVAGASVARAGVAPPVPVVRLAVGSTVVVLAVGAVCAAVATAVGSALGAARPAWVMVVLAAAGFASFGPAWPALSALRLARRSAVAVRDGDIVLARRHAAAGRESAWTAIGYALAALIVAGFASFAIANDAAVTKTFLRLDFVSESWRQVAKRFWVNVKIAVGAEVLVLVVGLVVAVMRMLPGPAGRPLRFLAIVYVDMFRAIPGIIVIFIVGFGLSLAEVPIVKDVSTTWLAIIALTLTYGAYVAEVYRAGLDSIHPSQWAAARSLGLSYPLTLRTVIVPQAVRRVIPPLLNDFVGLQKDTALVGVMGVIDAFQQARIIGSRVFNLTPVIVVAVLFILVTIPQARVVDRLIARDQERQRSGVA
jgi:polar amino acid transport system permease protein